MELRAGDTHASADAELRAFMLEFFDSSKTMQGTGFVHSPEHAELCRKQRQARTGGLAVCLLPAANQALETAEENTYPTSPSLHPASTNTAAPSTSASWVPEFPGSRRGRPGDWAAVNTRRNLGRCGMGKKGRGGGRKKKGRPPATARNPFGIATVSNRPHGAYEPGGKNVAKLELMADQDSTGWRELATRAEDRVRCYRCPGYTDAGAHCYPRALFCLLACLPCSTSMRGIGFQGGWKAASITLSLTPTRLQLWLHCRCHSRGLGACAQHSFLTRAAAATSFCARAFIPSFVARRRHPLPPFDPAGSAHEVVKHRVVENENA